MLRKCLSIGILLGFVSPMTLADTASQAEPGWYLGVEGGLSRTDNDDGLKDVAETSASSSVDQGGFGGRAYIGWHYNQYADLELGFTHYARNTYEGVGAINADLTTYAWDLSARGSLPLGQSPFSVYAKLGIANIESSLEGTIMGTSVRQRNTKVSPVFGGGISWWLGRNWTVDASYTQIPGKDDVKTATVLTDVKDFVPDGKLLALGIRYKFPM